VASSDNGKSGAGRRLDVSSLESWLWEAACTIRGPLDAPKFKDYILPLVFLKRLSDVFDDEIGHLAQEFGDQKTAAKLVDQDHKLVRFFIPPKARWSALVQRTTGLGEYLTDAVRAVARENPRLSGVIDVPEFNATAAGQRIVDDGRLAALVQVLNNADYRLGLDDVEPDILGRAYEYMLRKFAEGQGQSAGEFYTPREVAVVMARILDPQPGATVYDPCCGSGGLLIKCHLRLLEARGKRAKGRLRLPDKVAPLQLFGQEINPSTFAMSRMNAFVHDMEADIALGDTMHRPAFTEGNGRLRQFDIVTANPMWNQKFPAKTYENDPYDRFGRGVPPSSSADWGWVQHMVACLNERGRMAAVLDTGAVSRGSGNSGSNKERDIRKQFVEADLVEAVLLLPENLFYNTTAPGIVMVINKAKDERRGLSPPSAGINPAARSAARSAARKGHILLINASKLFAKGRPKNYLAEDQTQQIVGVYHDWKAVEGLSVIISVDEVAKNDFNLSPSRYVATGTEADVLPLDEAVVRLQEAEEERDEADRRLKEVLASLGFKE
jgi:type I restriction enzyme M protein